MANDVLILEVHRRFVDDDPYSSVEFQRIRVFRGDPQEFPEIGSQLDNYDLGEEQAIPDDEEGSLFIIRKHIKDDSAEIKLQAGQNG